MQTIPHLTRQLTAVIKIITCALLALALTTANAGTKYWGGSGTWTTANTWSLISGGTLDQTWVSGDDAIFDVVSTITGGTTGFNSLTANQNVVFTAGGTLGTGGTIGTVTVADGMVLFWGAQTVSTAAGTGFIKNGPGTWTLAGATYPGGFTLNAGTVGVGGVNAMGVGALTINGGTISNSPAGTARALTGKYTSVTIGGDFSFEGAANLTFNSTNALGGVTRNVTNNNASGSVVLNGPFMNGGLNLNGAGNWTFAPVFIRTATTTAGSSVITMADTTYVTVGQGISVAGASLTTGSVVASITPNTSITISGTATNAVSSVAATLSGSLYSGGTIISGGLARAGNDLAFGYGDITLNGGKLGTSAGATLTNNITLAADGDVANANSLTLSGVISGNKTLTHSGAGALTLAGANSYTGNTTNIVAASTLQLGGNSPLGTGKLVMGDGSKVQGSLGVGTITNDIILLGNAAFSGIQNDTFSGNISGSFGITNSSTATTTLTGNSTFTGDVTVTAASGTLAFNSDAALGVGGNINLAQNATIKATGTFATSKTITLSAGGQNQDINASGNTLTLNSKLTGGGAGTTCRIAAGTVVFNAANDYVGGLTVLTTCNITGAGTFGSTGNGLSLNSGSVNLGGTSQTVGSLSFIGNTSTLSNGDMTSTNITVNPGSGTVTVSANLHGTGTTLTKINAGKLVLSGTNDYTGNTTISVGILQIGNGGIAGSVIGNITNNATLIFNRANNYTFGGIITGSGTMQKLGNGVLTLSSGSDYSGGTSISNGVVWATSSTALGFGNVFVDAPATLAMTGTLALSGNLTNNGGRISIGLTDAPGGANDLLTVAGSLQNTATTTIALRGLSAGGALGVGTYTLMTYGSTNGTPTFVLDQNYPNATLNVGATALTLVVSGSSQTTKLWAGDGAGNAWNVETTANWTYNPGGTPVQFTNNDTVLIDDTSDNQTINLNTTVSPAAVTVNAAKDYVVTGNGKISGSASVAKSGSGILKLDGTSDYTGGTVVNAGSLFVSSNNAAGTGDITLNTGHNALAAVQPVSLANNLNLVAGTGFFGISGGGGAAYGFSTNLTITGDVNLNGSAKILSVRTSKLILNGAVTNGDVLVFNGNVAVANTLTLAGNNTFTGGVTVTNSGTLNINSATALGAGSGPLVIGGTSSITIDNTSAGSVSNANNNPVTIARSFNYDGTRSLDFGTGAVTMTASPTITVNANVLTIGGAITEDVSRSLIKAGNGALALGGSNTISAGISTSAGSLKINNANALGSGTLTISGGSIDNTSGAAISNANNNAQSWSGNFSFLGANDLNLGTGAVTLSAARTVTASAGNLTVGGVIGGAFSLTKLGNGTLTLSGANAFTGNLTNSAGTLVVPTVNNNGAAGPLGNNANAVSLGSSGNTAILEYTGATASSSKKLNLVTGGTGEVKIDDSGAILTLTGVIDGSGNLTKTGSGALRLNAVNLFAGNLTLSAGTLIAGGANTTCLGAGTLTLNGGEMQMISDSGRNYARNTTINGNVTMTSDKSSAGGAGQTYTFGTLNIGAQTLTVKAAENPVSGTAGVTFGAVTLGGAPTFVVTNNTLGATTLLTLGNITNGANALTFDGNGNSAVSGTIGSGAGGLTKNGNGLLTLSQSNSYAGDTIVNAGQLTLTDKDAIGRGTLIINSGGFAYIGIATTAMTNNIANGGSLQVAGNGTLSGILSGPGWLYHTGGGAFTLSLGGTNSGFSGVITNSATLALKNRWAQGSGTIYMGDVNAFTGTPSFEVASGSSGGFTGVDAITNSIVLLNDSSFGNNQRALEIAGVVSGSGALANAGTSTLTLSGANTFSGGMTVKSSTLLVKNATGSGTGSGAVVVTNAAALGGNGAIAGAVTAYSGTTVKPGLGGTDSSPLTINNNLTLNAGGTTLIAINRTNSPNNAATLSITGTLAKDGTLTVTNVGSALQGGDSFTIFNVTGGATGNFSATNLPTLDSGLNWWATNSGQTLIVNRAPTASALTMGALSGEPQTLKIIGGKHAPSDADTDGLTVAGVTQGAYSTAVTTDGTNVTYTSTNTFTGVDVFNYVVTDGRGGFATNTVTVTVFTSGPGYNLLSPPLPTGGGTVELHFLGIPTYPYALDWATNLSAPINWMPIITNNADTNGLVNFTNTSAEPANFFRTRTP